MISPRLALLVLLSQPVPALAEELVFAAAATITANETMPTGTLAIATGQWTATKGTQHRSFSGAVSQTAYRLAGSTLSTRDLMMPLRDGFLADGFILVFECETQSCGGFDFRYDLPLLAEPAMHVDLGDFRYFAATRSTETGPDEAVMIVASRSSNAGFVQVNRVGEVASGALPTLSTATAATPAPLPDVTPPPAISPVAGPIGDIATRLETGGAFALDDLVFPSGAAVLAPGSYASLAALAEYLAANPDRQIAIVGHTDASGGLDANIALSRRRAESVRRVLIETQGVRAAQVQAEGVGYLAPRASNLTGQGRAANRRVEVMLTSTE